jgi:uncharacterized protein (DUF305 family)
MNEGEVADADAVDSNESAEAADTADTDETDDTDDTDDVLVLPWWQRPANIFIVLVATALIAGMVGWLVADSRSQVDSSDVDVGFLQDMRLHHEQAIDMAFRYLERPDTDPRLRTVARSVIFDQGVEIGAMLQLLAEMDAPSVSEDGTAMAWMGHPSEPSAMPGMATEEQLDALATASGADADARFVDLMTAHHRGGIEMSEEAADRAENAEVRRLAASFARNQQSEIAEMEGLQGESATS